MSISLSDDDDWEQFCSPENDSSITTEVKDIDIAADLPENLLGIALTKLSQIIKFGPHLKYIHLDGDCNYLDHRLVSTVCEALLHSSTQQKIKVIFEFGETLIDDNFLPVANLMKSCTREIGLCISNDTIEEETLEIFADALRHLAGTVTDLDINRNGIGDDEACALVENLKVNTTLNSLDMWNNYVGDKGAKALADVLKQNGPLAKLNLSYNFIGDDGAIALGEAIACNVTLCFLDLDWNPKITEKVGIAALVNGLNRNSTLTDLRLSREYAGIEFALRRNKALLKEAAWMERFSDQDIVLKSKVLSKAMERYSMSDFMELTFLFLQRQRSALLTQAESVVVDEPVEPASKRRRV